MGSRIIGAAAGVAMNGRLVMAEGFGLKRKDGGNAVDADTQFRIGSSTKMLTAAGMLRLVDKGLVDLDAPISRYLPTGHLAFGGESGSLEVVPFDADERRILGAPVAMLEIGRASCRERV